MLSFSKNASNDWLWNIHPVSLTLTLEILPPFSDPSLGGQPTSSVCSPKSLLLYMKTKPPPQVT